MAVFCAALLLPFLLCISRGSVRKSSSSSSSSSTCLTDEDCNLNGMCIIKGDVVGGARGAARVCKCLAAWKGDSCGVLNLAPATPGAGFHAPTGAASSVSSWGGAIVYDAGGGGSGGGGPPNDGRWIMYANEMVGGCGINAWESNSRVR